LEKQVVEQEIQLNFNNVDRWMQNVLLPKLFCPSASPSSSSSSSKRNYCHIHTGNESDIKNLSWADIRSFFNKHYSPRNWIVSLHSSHDAHVMNNWVEQYFNRPVDTIYAVEKARDATKQETKEKSKRRKSKTTTSSSSSSSSLSSSSLSSSSLSSNSKNLKIKRKWASFVDGFDPAQSLFDFDRSLSSSYLMLAFRAHDISMQQNLQNFLCLELVHVMLAGHPRSLLFQSLRERRGWVYSISCSLLCNRVSTTTCITCSAQSSPERLDSIVRTILADIQSLKNQTKTVSELFNETRKFYLQRMKVARDNSLIIAQDNALRTYLSSPFADSVQDDRQPLLSSRNSVITTEKLVSIIEQLDYSHDVVPIVERVFRKENLYTVFLN
jgi:predicted Zn-dependent peptidase